ncbi:23082_t:CDS:2, partial [Racocetra persica]
KDVYNTLTCQARDRIKGLSQVAELLNNLQNKKEYTVTYSVNNNRLHSLFFTISNSLTAFKRYPEIVLMDSTYKTNHFGMPLLLNSGFDAMGSTFLIASGLISNETQLKQIAGDATINQIQTILTDKDLAMLSSVRNELSHANYQLCIWHLEQNLIKNLTGKLSNRFLAFSKDFKVTMMQNTKEMFETSWNHLLIEYPEVESYMNEQWKPFTYMWAYCFTNKNTNYGIRTTQRSEASNAHLKRLLGYTIPLPELINALDKLSYQQLQQQYNLAKIKNYSIKKQDNLFKVYYENNHKHTVHQTDTILVCSCDYTIQFSLPCRHIIALYIVNQKKISIDYIGERWIVDTNDRVQFRQQIITSNEFSASTEDFVSTVDSVSTINSASTANSVSTTDSIISTIDPRSTSNFVPTADFVSTDNSISILTTPTTELANYSNQQISRSTGTADLLKEIEAICNR